MEFVRNQYDMVITELVLKESTEQKHDQIPQEDCLIQMVRIVDRMFSHLILLMLFDKDKVYHHLMDQYLLLVVLNLLHLFKVIMNIVYGN